MVKTGKAQRKDDDAAQGNGMERILNQALFSLSPISNTKSISEINDNGLKKKSLCVLYTHTYTTYLYAFIQSNKYFKNMICNHR